MIRLGVIGYGGRIHGIIDHVLRRLDPSVRVVGVVHPDQAGTRTCLAAAESAQRRRYVRVRQVGY